MKETCVISFGDSATYRLPAIESNGRDLSKVAEDVKAWLKAKFPQLTALPFYSKMTVRKMNEADAKAYPEFNPNSLKTIKETLASEVADAMSIKDLNLNAPFANV